MPVICAATGCNNKFVKGSEIRFYRFPLSKPQLASKWVHSLGMKNFTPTANTCLCSEHFRPDFFKDYNGKQILRHDAVPTLFTHCQKSSKIELCKRGVVPKETNVANKMGTQTEQDGVREAANLRREKRGGIRYNIVPQVMPPGPVTQNPNPVGSLKRKRKNQQGDREPYVKKPPNAFMLFSKEQRANIKAELNTSDSRTITTTLGERWMALSTVEQDRYFQEAHRLRRLHQQQFPDWTPNSHKRRKADPVKGYHLYGKQHSKHKPLQ